MFTCRCFARTIVAEKSSDLIFIEIKRNIINRSFSLKSRSEFLIAKVTH
jgi:hypothetical protein